MLEKNDPKIKFLRKFSKSKKCYACYADQEEISKLKLSVESTGEISPGNFPKTCDSSNFSVNITRNFENITKIFENITRILL